MLNALLFPSFTFSSKLRLAPCRPRGTWWFLQQQRVKVFLMCSVVWPYTSSCCSAMKAKTVGALGRSYGGVNTNSLFFHFLLQILQMTTRYYGYWTTSDWESQSSSSRSDIINTRESTHSSSPLRMKSKKSANQIRKESLVHASVHFVGWCRWQ